MRDFMQQTTEYAVLNNCNTDTQDLSEFKRYLKVKGLAPLSIYNYEKDIYLYLRFCKMGDNNPYEEKYVYTYLSSLAYKGYKSSSIERKRAALVQYARFIKLSLGEYFFDKKKIKSPKKQKTLPIFYHYKEIQDMLSFLDIKKSCIDYRNYLILLFLFGTGLRAQELLTLTPENINEATGRVLVTGKGGKSRIVFLPDNVLVEYKKYKQVFLNLILRYKRLFFNLKKEPLNYGGLYFTLKELEKKMLEKGLISKTIKAHSFRHSFATTLLHRGGDIRKIAELLGHASLNVTQRYTQLNKKLLEDSMKNFHPHYYS
jgi:site-specific recombinase XerD